MSIVSLKNIYKTIGNNEIIKGVNVEFSSPGIYGIIGRNGTGKSVMLKILLRLYHETSGSVLFNGIKVTDFEDFPFSVRAFLEKPTFIPDLTGYDNLRLLYNGDEDRTDSAIETSLKVVGLHEEGTKKFKDYSFGMKQKLGVACAIMEQPEVLVLDEPFNGIEHESANTIREYLKELKKQDKIVIVSTHIRDDLSSLCDKIYEMNDGVLREVDAFS